MTRSVAFLGGINVGGHRVTMARLRAELEGFGAVEVSTFIASGNVIFSATGRAAVLERGIEVHLERALGYPVPTFVRRDRAVVEIAAREPFARVAAGDTHLVAFLRRPPAADEARAVGALANDTDTFSLHGAELHWRIHGTSMESNVKPTVLARALGQPYTTRNTTSLRKLAALLRDPAP